MAKKKAYKKTTLTAEAVPTDVKYRPSTYVSLTKGQVTQLEGIEIGDTVTVIMKGKVTMLSSSQSEGGDHHGELRLESPKITVESGEVYEGLDDED